LRLIGFFLNVTLCVLLLISCSNPKEREKTNKTVTEILVYKKANETDITNGQVMKDKFSGEYFKEVKNVTNMDIINQFVSALYNRTEPDRLPPDRLIFDESFVNVELKYSDNTEKQLYIWLDEKDGISYGSDITEKGTNFWLTPDSTQTIKQIIQ
jgi:hypothetical protein